jgi:hypothetical protein
LTLGGVEDWGKPSIGFIPVVDPNAGPAEPKDPENDPLALWAAALEPPSTTAPDEIDPPKENPLPPAKLAAAASKEIPSGCGTWTSSFNHCASGRGLASG